MSASIYMNICPRQRCDVAFAHCRPKTTWLWELFGSISAKQNKQFRLVCNKGGNFASVLNFRVKSVDSCVDGIRWLGYETLFIEYLERSQIINSDRCLNIYLWQRCYVVFAHCRPKQFRLVCHKGGNFASVLNFRIKSVDSRWWNQMARLWKFVHQLSWKKPDKESRATAV